MITEVLQEEEPSNMEPTNPHPVYCANQLIGKPLQSRAIKGSLGV